MSHIALYGNVVIKRTFCRACNSWALIIDGVRVCCDRPVATKPSKIKRIVEPIQERKQPLKKEMEDILTAQDNCCLYCDRSFNSMIWLKNRPRIVKVVWDHKEPWVYGFNNQASNFVASCSWCNGWKGSRMFTSLEEIRVHVAAKWRAKLAKSGNSDVAIS